MNTISSLPDECMLHTFEFLSEKDIYRSCFTTRRWMINLWPYAKHTLSVNESSPYEPLVASVKRKQSAVKRLTLIQTFEKFSLLDRIVLVDCGIGDNVLELFAHFYPNRLRHLNISFNTISAHGIRTYIPQLLKLEHLDVSGCKKLNNGIVSILEDLGQSFFFPPTLRELVLTDLDSVTFQVISNVLKTWPFDYVIAMHLMTFRNFDPVQLVNMLTVHSEINPDFTPISNTQEYLNRTLLCGYDQNLKRLYEILNTDLQLEMNPSYDVIEAATLAGNATVISSLFEMGYKMNDITPELVAASCLRGHANIVAKLRSRGYHRFNEMPQSVIEEIVEKGLDTVVTELRGSRLDKKMWEQVSVNALESAFLQGKKNIITDFRDMNLVQKLNAISVDSVHEVIDRGYIQALKQLLSCGYEQINEIKPQVVVRALERDHDTILVILKNAGYKHMDIVKEMNDARVKEVVMKQPPPQKSQKKKKK